MLAHDCNRILCLVLCVVVLALADAAGAAAALEMPDDNYLPDTAVGMRIAGNDQLVVDGPAGEFLVPMVAAICREISIERKEILVELPEGLMDLNG